MQNNVAAKYANGESCAMPRHAHHFEPQIAAIYNHLYANADFRTPRGIAREVTKVLHTGIFVEK